MDHDAITNVITKNRTIEYGVGILPNPYAAVEPERVRRHKQAEARKIITDKIEALTEPRFITPIETSEAIEALITLTDSRVILELGTCTGYGTLHMLRAVIGKPEARVVSVDARPAHDKEFWRKFYPTLQHVEGWTPSVLNSMPITVFAPYDLIFVDSDHSIQHCEAELKQLIGITRPGSVILFHDCPERQTPAHAEESKGVIFQWLHQKVAEGVLRGT